MTYPEALTALKSLYERIPPVPCQRRCQEGCGPIGMAHLEWVHIQRASPGRTIRATTLACPLLKGNTCLVYAQRPVTCRLWGVIPQLPCPHGCIPEGGMLTAEEGTAFLREAEALSQVLFPGKLPVITHGEALLRTLLDPPTHGVV